MKNVWQLLRQALSNLCNFWWYYPLILISIWLIRNFQVCGRKRRRRDISEIHSPDFGENFLWAKNLNLVWCGAKGAASQQWQKVLERKNREKLTPLAHLQNSSKVLQNSKTVSELQSITGWIQITLVSDFFW